MSVEKYLIPGNDADLRAHFGVTNEPVVQLLRETFPGHKIECFKMVDMSDFIPRIHIAVDGKRLKASWNAELIQELKARHGIDAEKEIALALIAEIKQHLST